MWRTVVNRISQWPTFILLSLAFIPYLAQWFAYDFLNDDAFISFRYSYNWAQFGEIVHEILVHNHELACENTARIEIGGEGFEALIVPQNL